MFSGTRLRDFRKERGYTLNQLAERIKVSPSYLSSIERNIKKPSISMLRDISNTLNISISYLFDDISGTVGERLKLLREGRGLSIQDLADLSNLDVYKIEQLEQGQIEPSLEQAEVLSDALNVSLRYFYEKSNGDTSLGSKIREVRIKVGMTAAYLADKAGVTPGLISQIENNQTIPLLDTLERIGKCLGHPASYFLLEQKDIEDLLASLNPEIRETLGDPQVQAFLRSISDLSTEEFKFIKKFIDFFKQNKSHLGT